jgi:membrane-associated phospholipid phosphatase
MIAPDQPADAAAGRPHVDALRLALSRADRAVYRAVADFSTPALDRPLRTISDFANHSKPWFIVAGALAIFGGPRGRVAALAGVGAIGLTSFVVNQPMKRARRRERPDRPLLGVPESRWVLMPTSTSFPSGHSASAAAFAAAVGHLVPWTRRPLRSAATTVAFSRVYTGVHYPGDVVIGATVGALIGAATARTVGLVVRGHDKRVAARAAVAARFG